MDNEMMLTLARLAGLERALAEHADDVAAACASATAHRAVIQAPSDPAVEPWPPMRTTVAR